MKVISSDAYMLQAWGALKDYVLDNPWFQWVRPNTVKLLDATATVNDVHYVYAAYTAYDKVGQNTLKMLLLGDTKLRSDETLVTNFGLSSARGVQEDKELTLVKKIMELRNEQAKVQSAATHLKVEPLPVVDAGSILSTKLWSPMLNDSFILGGAHRELDFYLALSGDEGATFNNIAAADAKEMWLKYFLANPGCIWATWTGGSNPRVLMRELLGLKLFGYEPRFDKNQLQFKASDKGASDGATLQGYLNKLNQLGFHEKGKKSQLFAAVSEFLFDDPKALDAVAKA